MNVNVLEARNSFSALIRRVEDNPDDVIVISRRGVPVAELSGYRRNRAPISFGLAQGEYELPHDWDINEYDDEIAGMMGV